MQNYSYQTRGVCAKKIDFEIEDGKLHNVKFTGGCPGNTAAVGKLLEGMDADKAVAILKGNDCNGKGTSCADQLAIAVEQALANSELPAQCLLNKKAVLKYLNSI